MPSDRLTARIPTTPDVRDELKERVDGQPDLETYDDYLRIVLGIPTETGEAAH